MDTLIAISLNIGLVSRPLLICFVLLGLALGLRRAPLANGARVVAWLAIAVPLLAWFVLMTRIGQSDLYQSAPWARRVAIVVPPLIWLTLLMRSKRVATVLDATPLSWVIGVQVYRLAGFVFLVQWAAGRLPGIFAIPAATGDILTGALALPVAIYVARRAPHWRLAGYAWNALGLADFAMALAIATFVVGDTGLRYPLIMIPTFAVPLYIVLHVLSLWQLSRAPRSPESSSAGVTTQPAISLNR
jgi:hypothetical protein